MPPRYRAHASAPLRWLPFSPAASASADQIAAFETDVLAGFVLARAAAGLADTTIAGDVVHLEQARCQSRLAGGLFRIRAASGR